MRTLLPAPASSPFPSGQDVVVTDFGLRAQSRLSPYVMGFFGIGVPVFVWSAQLGLSTWLFASYLILFVINWTAFMVLKGQAEKRQAIEPADLEQRRALARARLWRQGVGGAIWAVSLVVISLSAATAGPGAQMFLMVCAGAAVGIIFFSAPVLLHLLVLGPIAIAGPILGMQSLHEGPQLSQLMTGGLVLALAMGVVLNRHMRDLYLLQHRQEEIAAEREAARAATDDVKEARMALMETLQREVQTSLKGLEQHLAQGLTHLSRAPAPRHHIEAALTEVAHLQSILVTTVDNDGAAAGQIEVVAEPLDIDLLCQKVMAQHAHLAQGKELSFTYNAQALPDHGAAIGDAHRVEQVLTHLVSNALLYTQQGRVEIKLMPVDDYLRLEVVDSGPGLSEDELDHAFQPHSRIQRTSSGHSGAGLGLSLSRSLAELMGGRIGGQSTLDVGSKFWLDLPFDKTATPPARPEEALDGVEETSDHSLRVLLLSNDSLRAAQLRDSLERMGHKCLTSTSRERAVALARKAPVDACLISTGAFENLDEPESRVKLATFLDSLRATQAEASLNILALVPGGDQVDDLQAMGVRPLLLPQNRESLARALAAV
ncbi:hypothetical protein ABAC460_18580 [Asticcacaulis sp. AC460]|uniref:hybrid sensor histidine kinase/response regulator n=1 Tax=Asticcacaulis sp. AC460 TaxID=1282360 RepID=UPI0003C3B05F|nr:hybrid sensor histidine kinase/response regulator [Asticcacaulis sp. AC460]ESQ87680.1 hypothetical protein ABAC460_18580 [Asticcacaulis sp. AC460]